MAVVARRVHDAPALRAAFVPIRAFGIDIALVITILFRIRVDDTADRAVFVRHFWFDSAPARAVTRDHDLALHVYAHLRQLLVVSGHAVIDIDQLRGPVAVAGISVVSRKL